MVISFLRILQKRRFKVIKILILSLLLINPVYSQKTDLTNIPQSRYEKLELFNRVLYLIETQYYRDINFEKLIEGALKGMMSTLDPHSAYLPAESFSKMEEETQGEFGGLGIEVTLKDGVIVVITPIDDTPAFRADIRPGDKIVEIEGESMVGITLNEAVKKMRGKPNSKIKIGILREGVEGVKRITLTREKIKVKPVKAELVDEKYAYIRLVQFQRNSAKYIASTLKRFKRKTKKKGGLKGIILDLRANPGGLLDEAVNVSSLFLRDGIVVSIEGRDKKFNEIKFVNKGGMKDIDTPMVVLIDGSSASASEIVAGALKDHKRAILMGSRSFGKGSVQTVAKIDKTRGMKLTIAQYMTPSGKKIQAIGVEPDVYLDQVKDDWSKLTRKSHYTREKDLRGHLTATIETKEEKALRLEEEKEIRAERIKRIEELKNKKDKKVDKALKRYDPNEDYQVIQAINYLKSLETFRKLKF
ncbi:MAG: S41 family peptidase [Deltaproteobacteria bacterium]|nr:MAG: S41 family peptidase [Deltaproteobacteria bacterium]